MTADHPTPAEREYVDGSGNVWTYHPDRASFTRGPGDAGGNHAHWWVVDRYGPLTPAKAVAELARRDAALADLTRQREVVDAQARDLFLACARLRAQLERQAPVIEAARPLAAVERARRDPSVDSKTWWERWDAAMPAFLAAVSALGPVDPEATDG